MQNQIKVSVICLAYNQEEYIETAIQSFVSQITNFDYEIIIHDDASQDRTAVIINKYANKYPKLIKPILEKENQYKYGISYMFSNFILPYAQGEFIALCEADDYWIDNYKLQKQYDYMTKKPNCTFCFTNALIENQIDGSRRCFIPYNEQDRKLFNPEQTNYSLSNFDKLSFIPTASFFLKKDTLIKVFQLYKQNCPTGDLMIRLYSTAEGYAHFINDNTCVYRESVPNSAMTQWSKDAKSVKYKRSEEIYKMLVNLDNITNYSCHESLITFMVTHGRFLYAKYNIVNFLLDRNMREILHFIKGIEKIKCFIKLFIPRKFLM